MIEQVAIKNFQAHKDTLLKFTSGMNVIAGSSDNGKSSIIRAIRWIIMNRPSGFAFHTHGEAGDTEVSITFNNDAVSRRKGLKDSGAYQWKGKDYAALKTDVPPEIQGMLKMDGLNLQSQHDPYFLIQDSPGEVAKQLNIVAGMGIIGETLQRANQQVKKRKDELGVLVKYEEQLKTQIAQLSWVNDYTKDADELQELLKQVRPLEDKVATLANIIQQYNSNIIELNKANSIAVLRVGVDNVIASVHSYEEMQKKSNDLKEIIADIGRTEAQQAKAGMLCKFSDSLASATQMCDKANGIADAVSKLGLLVNSLFQSQKNYETAKHECDMASKDVADWKAVNPVCPTCGKPWS